MKKNIVFVVFLFMAAFGLTGCFNKQEKPITNITPEPIYQEPRVMLTVYPLDLAKSSVAWLGQKSILKLKETGTVKIKEGKLEFDGDKFIGGRFVLDMNTIETDSQKGEMKNKLEEHLKSADFFDVSNSPLSELIIKSVALVPEITASSATTTAEMATSTPETTKPAKYMITADLTIKGITKTVEFPAELVKVGSDIQTTAELKIDRSLWDIRYGSSTFFNDLGDKIIDNDINFTINILALNPNAVLENNTTTSTPATTTSN